MENGDQHVKQNNPDSQEQVVCLNVCFRLYVNGGGECTQVKVKRNYMEERKDMLANKRGIGRLENKATCFSHVECKVCINLGKRTI